MTLGVPQGLNPRSSIVTTSLSCPRRQNGDPALVAAALGDIARAKGMAQIARKAGLGRESLYKALSPEGNPEFATGLKVVRALGLRLHATTKHP